VLQRLNREIDQVFKSQEIRQRALGFGLVVSDAGTPESTAAFIRAEQERWRTLVNDLGMEAQ
jgi:tripartite-type tricarboxylate transporter receptor subunit TctC